MSASALATEQSLQHQHQRRLSPLDQQERLEIMPEAVPHDHQSNSRVSDDLNPQRMLFEVSANDAAIFAQQQ